MRAAVSVILSLFAIGAAPTESPSTRPAAARKTMRVLNSTVMDNGYARGTYRRTFGDMLAEVATVGKFPMDVKWDDLAVIGVTPKSTIIMRHYRRASLGSMLRLSLQAAGTDAGVEDAVRCPWFMVTDDGWVLISTREAVATKYAGTKEN